MSPTLRNLLIAGGVVVFLGFGVLLGAVGWRDDAVDLQEGVSAQWKDNHNQYDSFWKGVQEKAQVPNKYKEDFKELLVAETTAKYGEKGSQAQMQWFQERNIVLSEKMYLAVQNAIESGRNDFKRGQTELIDRQQVLSKMLKSSLGSILAGWFDLPSVVKGRYAPKEDIDGDGKLTVLDYPVVTSSKTEAVFQAGRDDEPIDVFKK